MNKNNYVAIMAGGIGSRFWPMSRTNYPKQFLDILNTGKTLLQSTYDRYHAFIPNQNIYIVTSEEYIPIIQQQLPQLPPENIIGEPERKNTAPSIAYISFKLQKMNPEANLIVAPSDHLIEDPQKFQHNCLQALNFTARNNAFVTLGIKPTNPNTGYGYIQKECSTTNIPGIYPVKRFTEKPDRETATAFVNSGEYFWNSGIFIWKVRDIISAFRLHSPDLYDVFLPGLADFNTAKEKAAITHIFNYCTSISIDYAIMEKAKNVFVIPADFNWSDLGTWNSAWEIFEKDEAQNAIAGENTLLVDSNGCVIHSTEKKLVMVGGMDDLIVVNTKDALLICKKENEQQIKEYLVKIKQTKGEVYL
jgi:mannose-1-phosphate guanylyltransferase